MKKRSEGGGDGAGEGLGRQRKRSNRRGLDRLCSGEEGEGGKSGGIGEGKVRKRHMAI